MTSLKKPLIAIASAVALVGTMLIAVPANASSVALTIAGSSASGGTTAATAIAVPVPSDNDVSSADTVRIAITNLSANTTVSATATNAKLVTKVTTGSDVVKADAGTSSVSVSTGTGTTADIYVYTTTTATGSVSVTVGGNTTVYYVKGTAGSAYNVAVSVPAVANLGADVNFTATATDVFGNAVENATITTTLLRGTVKTALTWNATDKLYKGVITAPATAGSVAGIVKITASDVAGLPKSVTEAGFSLAVADLVDQVKVLSDKLAASEAALAAATNKFNKLAKRWNKANPKKKVKLIK